MTPRPPRPRFAAGLALALASSLALAGCERGSRSAPLLGHAPANAARVGEIRLPEVRADGGSSPFRLRAATGHVLVVYFGYTTCPDVCPTTLADLRHAIARLGNDTDRVEVAFVTVDRARDTPDLLAPYLAAFVAHGHPLRPESDAQLALAERGFGATSSVSRGADGEIEVSHSGTSYLVDPDGRIVDQWPFGSSSDLMAHDLRLLLAATCR